ncbi:MAG: porin, partial [Hyphomicrobiaceae bacterium]
MFGGLTSISRVALVAAAVSMGGVAAQAADLGGNCCADLEERIAELEATTARKGNRVMSLTVYGQVNRAMVWHNDDLSTVPNVSFRDAQGRSGTRFGFRGQARFTSDLTIGYRLELGISDNAGTSLSESFVRESAVFVRSASLGTLTFGRTSTATDGLAEIALGSYYTPFGGEESTNVSPIIAGVMGRFEAIDGSRRAGVHYTSPTLAGFIFSASYYHRADANTGVDNDE